MNSKVFLIAVAAVLLTFPAQARYLPGTHTIDEAAIAPYPTTTAHRQTGSHRVERHRVARYSHEAVLARPERSYGEFGIVRSAKTGATAHVAPRYAAVFQGYIDDLEAHGATVKFMGGYRRGPCAAWSEHPCGKALDVCQLSRGVVDHRCNLPGRAELIEIANRHGLQEGGEWCSSDKGHAQIDRTAARCGHNLYAAVKKFKTTELAAYRHHPHHRHTRYARR